MAPSFIDSLRRFCGAFIALSAACGANESGLGAAHGGRDGTTVPGTGAPDGSTLTGCGAQRLPAISDYGESGPFVPVIVNNTGPDGLYTMFRPEILG